MHFSTLATLAFLAMSRAAEYGNSIDYWSFDLAGAHNPEWMSSLADSTPLSMMSIPGTHNSMTYKMTDEKLQSQNVPLTSQLTAGIRYFDISGRLFGNRISVYHGNTNTEYTFEDVFTELFNFLDLHPRETILLRIQKDAFFESSKNFYRILDGYLTPRSPVDDPRVHFFSQGSNGITGVPTLGAVRGKVFVLQDFKAESNNQYGLSWGSSDMSVCDIKLTPGNHFLRLRWAGTKEFMTRLTKKNSKKLRVTHTSVSAGARPIEIAAGVNDPGMNMYLGTYLRDKHKGSRVGVIAMDFPGKSLIEEILKLNNVYQDSSRASGSYLPGELDPPVGDFRMPFLSDYSDTPGLAPANPEAVVVFARPTANILTLSVPFLRYGRFPIGGRATVARLGDGSLAVFSPIALTPSVRSAVREFGGDVRYIIAPDIEHHMFLSAWKSAFPQAQLIGVEGLPEKRAAAAAARGNGLPQADSYSDPQITDIPFTTVFQATNKATLSIGPAFDESFSYEYVDGHKNKELVFLHKADRVLIQADLIFNLPATEQYSKARQEFDERTSSLRYKIFRSFLHTDVAHMTRPRIWQHYMAENKESYKESMRRIADWNFDTIIPCHGDVMKGDGKQRFMSLMKPFLN
ncbi:1-phosphatidylinositol phosphodiesterase [Ceratocystis platani]|uniref:1-phosphatidylinositol phosphodiesterase n=1 Tax=Ceratocystis fimbriata f. sp. platani TaxID=88771 RepID=A0A0F8BJ54_CERFI|nr:1-phosphatidylinositol phosphodiesterase [Ceratocystis platani]